MKRQTLGEMLAAAREVKGLTQEEVGKRVDLSVGMISQLEADKVKPSVEALVRLRDALGLDANRLLEAIGRGAE